MTTYYLNTVPTPTGYSYYYTASRATSSAASSSAYSTAPSKRATRSTSSGSAVSPSAFSAAYAKAYGESSSSRASSRPPCKSSHSAPLVDRSVATPRKCYEPARAAAAAAAPAAPSAAPMSQSASRKASRPSLRQPRTSFDLKRTMSADDKHVHFVDQKQAQRPPLKQSQTWSSGDKLPQAVRAASAPAPGHTELHPLFAYSRMHRASISYDTAYPPSSSTLVDRKTRTSLSMSTLSEPATSPPTPTNSRLVLTSHKLPWAVVVSPSPAGGRSPRRTPITNLDVLHAVHTTLMRPITAEEWAALGNGSAAQKKVQAAFERRCEAAGGGWENGVRRIDWLGGKTRLVGVEPAGAGGVNGTLVFATPKS